MNVTEWGIETGEQSVRVSYKQENKLPQKDSCRWSIVTAQLPAEHHGVAAEDTDYHARPLVDHVKSKISRIHIINLYRRKSMTLTICKSGAYPSHFLAIHMGFVITLYF